MYSASKIKIYFVASVYSLLMNTVHVFCFTFFNSLAHCLVNHMIFLLSI